MFLHLSVILFMGDGEYLGRYPWTRYTPGTRYTPQLGTPPRTRYTPDQVHQWDQVHPPGLGTPPGTRYPSQQMATVADGMHPTGMHSCFLVRKDKIEKIK